MIGACRTMLERWPNSTPFERIQFGVLSAPFQAVRHRLAEALVAIEAAAASCDALIRRPPLHRHGRQGPPPAAPPAPWPATPNKSSPASASPPNTASTWHLKLVLLA